MMHLCRELFPTILENEGKLLSILEKYIAPTHLFASDIKRKHYVEDFKNWIYSLAEPEHDLLPDVDKTPFQLMDEAGYILYECHSEEDIQRFRKYYAKNELLCTIYNGGRLGRCFVFFAVKKNVSEIRREDFLHPEREDMYGTSVISIQFSRGDFSTLSIKNRYNHTVNNPDCTFSNNLENIIPGLTRSFEKYLGINIHRQEATGNFLYYILKYRRGNDGRFYRYNIEDDDVYYCENNIIIDSGRVITDYAREKKRYIVIDEYIVDLKEKSISRYKETYQDSSDSFLDSINEIGSIKRIDVQKKGGNRIIIITYENQKNVQIEINESNQIIGYINEYVTNIKEGFLHNNKALKYLSLSSAKKLDDNFLLRNEYLSILKIPMVEEIGANFLYFNSELSTVELPQVKAIGNSFLNENTKVQSFSAPLLKFVGNRFLYNNKFLTHISLPQVEKIESGFLTNNSLLESINLNKVKIIGNRFLSSNRYLKNLSLPCVREI